MIAKYTRCVKIDLVREFEYDVYSWRKSNVVPIHSEKL